MPTNTPAEILARVNALWSLSMQGEAASVEDTFFLADTLRAALQLLNTPEAEDFAKAVVSEAQHQRARWGTEHDTGKTPLDWFWLVGYLAQKAAAAQMSGDTFKAQHHTISTAAALANWHAAISGASTAMRPGIGPGSPAFDAALSSPEGASR